jgi:peptidoglycan/LPS O-acetylase OafA/YrhL
VSSTLRNVPALDGIRALAISLVMLLHFRLFYDGWIGVQVFFVLSGFLITSILLDGRDVPFGTYLKRFFGRRFLRIFPLYYGFLLLLVLGLLLTGKPAEL